MTKDGAAELKYRTGKWLHCGLMYYCSKCRCNWPTTVDNQGPRTFQRSGRSYGASTPHAMRRNYSAACRGIVMKAGFGFRYSGEDANPRGITVPSALYRRPVLPYRSRGRGNREQRICFPPTVRDVPTLPHCYQRPWDVNFTQSLQFCLGRASVLSLPC
ncbi:hypothetical protein L226DRAFT_364879 [Lentinus tigrinus ALCF2SS1-7]|uniref:uncharacterized protein n=1 Tax=Lentinus tigrinus ALCF2SS1-7 TaxID=1328758 RepID=UPI001165F1ED|nr:hypothetical protein L226DRAFT_364879 [Lentinus tigrinus ALCF2SS1-7]